MGTATRLSPTPAPPAPSRGDAGVRARAASQNSACLHPSPAGGKEGAFYFSRQEPSRAFADARLEEGMLILFRTLRQPVFPSMPKYPGLFTVGPWLGALGALPALVQIAEPLGEQESLGALVAAW